MIFDRQATSLAGLSPIAEAAINWET